MTRPLTQLLRRGRSQDGTVIVIVAVVLACALGAGALAIDLSSGRQARQRAQAGADAAAAAGADQIVATNPSATPRQAVVDAATAQAQNNGACATCVTVTYPYNGSDYTRVAVAISGSADGTVGAASGRRSIPVSASAVAAANDSVQITSTFGNQTLTNTVTTTSSSITHGNNAIFFAADTSCAGGITMSGDSGTTIDGETFSNGGIHLDKSSDFTFNGGVYYHSGCDNSGIRGSQAAAPYNGWPEDFTAVPESTICNGNIQQGDITISSDRTFNGPVCATGTITLTSNSHLTGTATFVANSIVLQGTSNATLTPYYQDLLFYQTGSGPLQITGNSSYAGGTIFVPNGSLLITGNSNFGRGAPSIYVEAQDITITGSSNTTIQGDGANAAATTSTTTGVTTTTSVTTTPTTVTNTTSIGSSLVQ